VKTVTENTTHCATVMCEVTGYALKCPINPSPVYSHILLRNIIIVYTVIKKASSWREK
jgi:hypothetical protein